METTKSGAEYRAAVVRAVRDMARLSIWTRREGLQDLEAGRATGAAACLAASNAYREAAKQMAAPLRSDPVRAGLELDTMAVWGQVRHLCIGEVEAVKWAAESAAAEALGYVHALRRKGKKLAPMLSAMRKVNKREASKLLAVMNQAVLE